MKLRAGLLWLMFALCLGLFLVGCDDEDEKEPTVQEIIDIGKDYLITGDGPAASDAFHAALVRDPQNTDAQFGVILSNLMQFTSLLSELINMVTSMLDVQDPVPVDEVDGLSPQGALAIGDLIQEFVGNILLPKFIENETLYTQLSANGSFKFELAGAYELDFIDTQLVSFAGEFDQGELQFFGAVNPLLLAVFQIVMAHDINFDFENLNLDLGGGAEGEEPDIMDTIAGILALIEGLISDPNYPNFLYLDDDGQQMMQAAGLNLGFTFFRVSRMLDAVREETDDQDDDPIYYEDLNENGEYDADEPINLGDLTAIDPALVPVIWELGGDLAVAMFDTTNFDLEPMMPNPLYLESFNGLLMYLELIDAPFLGHRIGIPIGPFFASPAPDGLRSILLFVINIWDLVSGFIA